MKKYYYKKELILLIKYYPVLCSLGIFIILILNLYGVNTPIFESTINISFIGGVVMCLFSYLLEFCLWHRILIGYCTIFNLLKAADYYSYPLCTFTANTYILILLSIITFYIAFKYRNHVTFIE